MKILSVALQLIHAKIRTDKYGEVRRDIFAIGENIY
jgi:hypothetical protein